MIKILVLFLTTFLTISIIFSQVSINENGSQGHESAVLDIQSGSKGLLIPRMSTIARESIAGPGTGLIVFDTDSESFWFYTGNAWRELQAGIISFISDADDDTKIEAEKNLDEDILRFSIGGIEYFRMKPGRLETLNFGYNTLLGDGTGSSMNGTDLFNVAIGDSAFASNTIGQHNVAIGYKSLFLNLGGSRNTVVGAEAMLNNQANENTSIGWRTLANNTIGEYNTAMGASALRNNITGERNVALGREALYNNLIGDQNTAVGFRVLNFNTTGHHNTGLGTIALQNNTTGHYNTGVGHSALKLGGNFNTAVGAFANNSGSNGSYNTGVGYGVIISSGLTNATAIGANARVERDSAIILGRAADVGIGTNDPKAKLHVVGDLILGENGTSISSFIRLIQEVDIPEIKVDESILIELEIPGALPGGTVYVSPSENLANNLLISYARVKANDIVEIKLQNTGNPAIDPDSMDFNITVIQ